jgi:hypothetical protein
VKKWSKPSGTVYLSKPPKGWDGRRHHRRGRWYGWGYYGYPYYYGGGTCYGNCLAAGYSPGYCSENAADFC